MEAAKPEENHNYNLIKNLEYRLILQAKLDQKPEGLNISQVFSMCAACLEVAEGKKSLVLLDKDSSKGFAREQKHDMAIEALKKQFRNEDELSALEKRTKACEEYRYYVGLEKRSTSSEKSKDDCIDQRPYMLIGNMESYIEREIDAEEVKLLIPIEEADILFGFGNNQPKLEGLTDEEIRKYNEFRTSPEKSRNAFCRSTTARIYGTFDNREPSDLNFTKICKGAEMRTAILNEAHDTLTRLDPERVFLISFSGKRFQELFSKFNSKA